MALVTKFSNRGLVLTLKNWHFILQIKEWVFTLSSIFCPKLGQKKNLNFFFNFLKAICRCPKNLLYWPATDRCYPKHSRGPCEANQYLEVEEEIGAKPRVSCQQTKICENGWIFWPPMQDCFQLYTQGPCHKVILSIMSSTMQKKANFGAKNSKLTFFVWFCRVIY